MTPAREALLLSRDDGQPGVVLAPSERGIWIAGWGP